jgi:hypothetical protein
MDFLAATSWGQKIRIRPNCDKINPSLCVPANSVPAVLAGALDGPAFTSQDSSYRSAAERRKVKVDSKKTN